MPKAYLFDTQMVNAFWPAAVFPGWDFGGLVFQGGDDFKKILAFSASRLPVFLLLPFKINLQMKAKRTVIGKLSLLFFLTLLSSLLFSYRPVPRHTTSAVSASAFARFNLLYDSLGLEALALSRAAYEHYPS
jgi:hypothetical protein